MSEILNSLLSYLAENWPELIWIVAAAGIASYLAGRRSRNRWRQRDFVNRLNVSLNSIRDGTLRIRTILEADVESVFLNASAARTIMSLAKQTTADDPIIAIPRDDCWYYLNSVLNEISERFAIGHLRLDAGLAVERVDYVLCLTCERAGQVRTHKIRGMLIQKSLLESLPAEEPEYEHAAHATRWDTLQKISQRYQLAPHYFMHIELCL